MELKRLLEERSNIGAQMNELVNLVRGEQDRAFTADELQKFDRMENEFKALTDKIETAQRLTRMADYKTATQTVTTTNYNRPVEVSRQDKDLAFKYWAMKACGLESMASERHTKAAEKVGVVMRGDHTMVKLCQHPYEIKRNQSSQLLSEGGALMNDGLMLALERNLKWFGGGREVAKIYRSEDATPKTFTYSDDTSNVGNFIGQNKTVSNTSVVYQRKTLGAYEYVSAVYPVSLSLLQDAQVSVSDDVGEVLGIRLGRGLNPYYTSGTGASTPRGFLTDATLGATAGSDTIAYDDLVSVYFSMNRAYRETPETKWTMSDSTLSALWQLVDGNSRPLFWNQLHSLAEGNQLNIFGHDIVINNDMPAPAVSGHKPIALVNQGGFIINDVDEIKIVVLRERYMDELAIGFIAYMRTDSMLINPNRALYLLLP
jgi:HK97 family phage major capsid protein